MSPPPLWSVPFPKHIVTNGKGYIFEDVDDEGCDLGVDLPGIGIAQLQVAVLNLVVIYTEPFQALVVAVCPVHK